MSANIGNIDRIVRAALGIVLLLAGLFSLTGGAQIAALVVGVVLLGTAGMRFCLLYRILGVNTCKL